GTDYYICVSNAAGSPGAEYELSISGDIDRDALITANNSLASATRLVGTAAAEATINGWVGLNDSSDFYRFDMSGDGRVRLMLSGLESMARVNLYKLQEDGTFSLYKSYVGRASSGLNQLQSLNSGAYALEVRSYDSGAGRYNTGYALEIEKMIGSETERLMIPSSSLTDNNAKENASTLIESNDPEDVIVGWVGSEDATDYYRLELASAGALNLSLHGLETNVRISVYQQRPNGSLSSKLNVKVDADNGLDSKLVLAGGTYFVQVSSYDNGAGRYNTTYALELEQEDANGETKRFTVANS
ncbi:MAG: hypothetical protein IJB00_06365, partial [Akkermansia sp.]|nr:hypothetical protein [Akkermansia sp.]